MRLLAAGSLTQMMYRVSGKMPPGEKPTGKVPPRKLPPGNKPPKKIAPQENCFTRFLLLLTLSYSSSFSNFL